MCGCEPGFVCTRCTGTPFDWRRDFEPEPESPEETAYRLTNEHVALVIEPALRKAA